ncbi:uncharacterized protein LOC126971680 isoform X2 [Leptidea sinapis]|uniref:uncharacterized protein LOC126971680 isoform X2 n=1 Tax=Leptidea sinapis TaxID=189913 RepID=UPI00213C20E3|nr:uncharacterized protein LOC126971680 isoform X2 [Leptidea sinapis]
MTERAIASRPSLEQVMAIVDFMKQHPALGLGQLRGIEGREESKKLWMKLTRIVNNINGPTRPMKSWIKYWADKKSTVRSKVVSSGNDSNILSSNIDKRIWDLFLANDDGNKSRNSVKVENSFLESNNTYNENSLEDNAADEDIHLSETNEPVDVEERHLNLMEKLVKVMTEQANAMLQLAQASQASSEAMEKMAEASNIQSRAIERLAGTFETIGSTAHDITGALVDIDATMKRFYTTAPT